MMLAAANSLASSFDLWPQVNTMRNCPLLANSMRRFN
jgi:hypothetical protein